ncbi:MAG: GTP cyclohydrolase II [Bacteroidetes bacterium]|nr:MAG: GTP cyclohydrolase II [Bacteroidota bacterium]
MKKQAEAMIPTPWGEFNMIAFSDNENEWMPHLALVHKSCDISSGPVLTRVHSECITGDLFGSKRCDCGEQLDMALKMAAEQGGLVLYLRQEGRGIGIINKLKAYNLQDSGLNTVDANLHLGLERDARQYDIAVEMLVTLGISEIRLLTNNPEKIEAFENGPVKVTERVPIVIKPNDNNRGYLKTKQDEMGHMYKL